MYSFAEAEERGEIDVYDFRQIQKRGGPKETASVVRSWTDHDCEPNFAGVVYTYMGFYSFEAWTDYTGWGCGEFVEWFGPYPTELESVQDLTLEAKRNLGYEESPISEEYLYGSRIA